MLTETQKNRLKEIDRQIADLMAEKEQINPFANLKSLSNKAFGEGWSEPYILEQCPQLEHTHGKGNDFYSEKVGRIEVKSSRLPCKQITFNQLHPKDCDQFLFVLYDTENADSIIYMVPSEDIEENFSITKQHDRHNDSSCFSMGMTRANSAQLENYRINSWDELSERV